jgi:hypothetical protein
MLAVNKVHVIAEVGMNVVLVLDAMKEVEISAKEEAEVAPQGKEEQAVVVMIAVPAEEQGVVEIADAQVVQVVVVVQVAAADPEEEIVQVVEPAAAEAENRNKYQLKEVGKAYLCRTFFKKS